MQPASPFTFGEAFDFVVEFRTWLDLVAISG